MDAAEEYCDPAFPNLAVGDALLNAENFDEFKKDNKLFVLGVSDSNCGECCVSEPLLHAVWRDF